MGEAVDEHLGRRLCRRRQSLGLTQQQLGTAIGVRFQQVHKYECGLSRMSPARLCDIANALGVGVGYFFDGLEAAAPIVPRPRLTEGDAWRAA
ncbi:MAG: helix-turn-helix domain-containing protein [Mycobacteriales bacterium]